MDAIKKKMQAMKMEKDAAMDKADTCEGQAKDANLRADKVCTPFTFLSAFLSNGLLNFTANLGYGRCPRSPKETYSKRDRFGNRQEEIGRGQQGTRRERKSSCSSEFSIFDNFLFQINNVGYIPR